MPVWTHYFAHFVVTVIATIAFGVTFQVPRRHYLAAGITGAVGWMVYIFGVELLGMSPAIATLVATLPLTGCARCTYRSKSRSPGSSCRCSPRAARRR